MPGPRTSRPGWWTALARARPARLPTRRRWLAPRRCGGTGWARHRPERHEGRNQARVLVDTAVRGVAPELLAEQLAHWVGRPGSTSRGAVAGSRLVPKTARRSAERPAGPPWLVAEAVVAAGARMPAVGSAAAARQARAAAEALDGRVAPSVATALRTRVAEAADSEEAVVVAAVQQVGASSRPRWVQVAPPPRSVPAPPADDPPSTGTAAASFRASRWGVFQISPQPAGPNPGSHPVDESTVGVQPRPMEETRSTRTGSRTIC